MEKEEQRFCNLGRIGGETMVVLNRLERTGKKIFASIFFKVLLLSFREKKKYKCKDLIWSSQIISHKLHEDCLYALTDRDKHVSSWCINCSSKQISTESWRNNFNNIN